MLHGHLIIIKRTGEDGSKYPVTERQLKIGTTADCRIIIRTPTVSSEHCQLVILDSGRVKVKNLSLGNPTLINSKILNQETLLNHGDVLEIGGRWARWEYLKGSPFFRQHQLTGPNTARKSLPFIRTKTPVKEKKLSTPKVKRLSKGSTPLKPVSSNEPGSSGKNGPKTPRGSGVSKIITGRKSLQVTKLLMESIEKKRRKSENLSGSRTPKKTPTKDLKQRISTPIKTPLRVKGMKASELNTISEDNDSPKKSAQKTSRKSIAKSKPGSGRKVLGRGTPKSKQKSDVLATPKSALKKTPSAQNSNRKSIGKSLGTPKSISKVLLKPTQKSSTKKSISKSTPSGKSPGKRSTPVTGKASRKLNMTPKSIKSKTPKSGVKSPRTPKSPAKSPITKTLKSPSNRGSPKSLISPRPSPKSIPKIRISSPKSPEKFPKSPKSPQDTKNVSISESINKTPVRGSIPSPKTTTVTPKPQSAKTPRLIPGSSAKSSAKKSPKASVSKSPRASTKISPKVSTTKSPKASATKTPRASTNISPKVSTTKSPKASATKTPRASTKTSPVASTTKTPRTSTKNSPKASTSKSPRISTTKSPKGSSTKSPRISTTESPKGSSTKSPKASATKSPRASTTKTPKASATKSPRVASEKRRGVKRKLELGSEERPAKKLKPNVRPDKNKKKALMVLGKALMKTKPEIRLKAKIVKKAVKLSNKKAIPLKGKGKKKVINSAENVTAEPQVVVEQPITISPSPMSPKRPSRSDNFIDLQSISRNLPILETFDRRSSKRLSHKNNAVRPDFTELSPTALGLTPRVNYKTPAKGRRSISLTTPRNTQKTVPVVRPASTTKKQVRKSVSFASTQKVIYNSLFDLEDVTPNIPEAIFVSPERTSTGRCAEVGAGDTPLKSILTNPLTESELRQRYYDELIADFDAQFRNTSRSDRDYDGTTCRKCMAACLKPSEINFKDGSKVAVFDICVEHYIQSHDDPKQFRSSILKKDKVTPNKNKSPTKIIPTTVANDSTNEKSPNSSTATESSTKNNLKDMITRNYFILKSARRSSTNVNSPLKPKSTPIPGKSPRNDLTDVRGVKKLLATPKLQKSPKNDLTEVKGVKKLMATPKPQKSPRNDLTNIRGVKKLLTTPKQPKSPKNDLTDVRGVKKVMATPKQQKSPKNDLTDVRGVKKLMATPKQQKSPKNDLTNVPGVKKLMASPKPQKSPKNDLTNVKGLKRLMTTPKQQKTPKNDLTDVRGVKKLMSTPKNQRSPLNDLSDIAGIKRLFRGHGSPKNNLSLVEGIVDLFQSPEKWTPILEKKETKVRKRAIRGSKTTADTPDPSDSEVAVKRTRRAKQDASVTTTDTKIDIEEPKRRGRGRPPAAKKTSSAVKSVKASVSSAEKHADSSPSPRKAVVKQVTPTAVGRTRSRVVARATDNVEPTVKGKKATSSKNTVKKTSKASSSSERTPVKVSTRKTKKEESPSLPKKIVKNKTVKKKKSDEAEPVDSTKGTRRGRKVASPISSPKSLPIRTRSRVASQSTSTPAKRRKI